jgi:hypothetical protein
VSVLLKVILSVPLEGYFECPVEGYFECPVEGSKMSHTPLDPLEILTLKKPSRQLIFSN